MVLELSIDFYSSDAEVRKSIFTLLVQGEEKGQVVEQ
jgi:hypothetical protein